MRQCFVLFVELNGGGGEGEGEREGEGEGEEGGQARLADERVKCGCFCGKGLP